jgi:hypothetical protein
MSKMELTIVAESIEEMVSKLAEVSQELSGANAPLTPEKIFSSVSIEQMVSAINEQLPKELECMIVDITEEAKKAETKPKKAAKKSPAKKTAKEIVEEAEEPEEAEAEDTGDTEDTAESDGDPKADFEAALEILASCYTDENGKPKVKALLDDYEVKRFAEIDVAKGSELLAAASAIKAELG